MKSKQSNIITKKLLEPLTDEQLNSLSREELLVIARNEQKIRCQYEALQEEAIQLKAINRELKEQKLLIDAKYVRIKSKLFAPKSEKSEKPPKPGPPKARKKRGSCKKKPSDRYPNIEIIEKNITYEQNPICSCCSVEMSDSGMVEDSEYLTVIPKKYFIVRQLRHIYKCKKCHGNLQTAPAIPRIIPGGSYSDELIIDSALSKFCDLIPMERYCAIAKRQGLPGLPPNSLINTNHKLADFVMDAYELIKFEVQSSLIMLGDETPHPMLEGSDKKRWYLWCFSSPDASYFEIHDTRAGSVANDIITDSQAIFFMSDAFSGYRKAIAETNKIRLEKGLPLIVEANCNAHARRYYKDCGGGVPEAKLFIDLYKKIYRLNKLSKKRPNKILKFREKMSPYFTEMKNMAEKFKDYYSTGSDFYKACNYFLNNYDRLTVCVTNPIVPLDNNASERMLRSPVIGRKTWLGTHSRRGAKTAAVHFTLVESCKIIGVNPREYYRELVSAIHQDLPAFTPRDYQKKLEIESKKLQ
jgi:transposase